MEQAREEVRQRQADIARREVGGFRVVHCLLPVWRDGAIASASEPGSIAVAFTGQSRAVVREAGGAAQRRAVPPGTIGLCGDRPIDWLETDAPSDIIEISGTAGLRREMAAEMRVERHASLDDLHGWHDPGLNFAAVRLRATLRGWFPMSDMEAETLIRAAYAQAFRLHFGGRDKIAGTLDTKRRKRVADLVHDGDRPLTLTALATAAALSPFHFARSFNNTFGMPPHRYVTIVRLERARTALQSGSAVPQAAAVAGFSNLHHFRRLFRRHYGTQPSAMF